MALSHSPSIVTSGLALYLDAANTKSYDRYENLITYSNDFSNAVWSGYCGPKTSLTYNTTEVTDPNGTFTATKIARNSVSTCTGAVGEESRGFLWVGPTIVNTTDTYTVSVYVRGAVAGDTVNFGFNDSQVSTKTLTTSWQRITYTGIPNSTSRGIQIYINGLSKNYYIWGAQVEKGSVANDYYGTTGSTKTRGTSWNDLTNRNNVTLSNTSFVSGNIPYFSFNGTSSYGSNFSANNPLTGNSATVMVWIYPDTTQLDSTYSGMFALGTKGCALGNGNGQTLLFSMSSSRALTMAKWCDDSYSSIAPSANTWSMVSLVKNGASTQFGINASTFQDAANTGTQNFSGSSLTIGCTDNPGRYFSGRIASVILYDRALTTSEIQQNFNALKGRFGI